MSFDPETVQLVLSDEALKPYQRLLLLEINRNDNQLVQCTKLITHLGTSKQVLITRLQELLAAGFVNYNNPVISCVYNQQTSCCTVDDLSLGAVRKARPEQLDSVTKARQKLDELRMIGFVGTDALVAKLSRSYDNTLVKFGGKNSRSLSPNPNQAIRSKNWVHFKRLYALLVDRQFDTVQYLEAQFRAMNPKNKASKAFPLPAMLYSNWATNNYLFAVQDRIARSNGEDKHLTECDVVIEVMQSSHLIVTQLMKSNPELTKVQALSLLVGSISDVYLAIQDDYLKFVVKYEQELPEEIGRILVRFERDKEFKALVKSIYQEVSKI